MRILVTACLMMICLNLFSQEEPATSEEEKNGYFTVALNAAIPLGWFGPTDLDNQKEKVYAKPGGNISLNMGRVLFKNIVGFNATLGYTYNVADKDLLSEDLTQLTSGDGTVRGLHFDGFHTLMITSGLLVSIPHGKGAVDFRVQGGMQVGFTPEHKYIESGSLVTIERATGLGIVGQFGITARFHLNERLVLAGNVDYLIGDQTPDESTLLDGTTLTATRDYHLKFSMLMAGIGIGFRLLS